VECGHRIPSHCPSELSLPLFSLSFRQKSIKP
jgi:hypothetical protein